MKPILINNPNLTLKLETLARLYYKKIATYNWNPRPHVSLARLHEIQADWAESGEYIEDIDNTIYYTGRNMGDVFTSRLNALVGAMNINCNTKNFYISCIAVQQPKWGWSAWTNSQFHKRNIIRFIHNAGEGFTNWVEGGKRYKLPDQHREGHNWTCITGTLDGDKWLSDRNKGEYPRFIIELSCPNTNIPEFEKAKQIIQDV